eukprot:GHVU01037508.1.p2 GENE.GHVU01037508.1~~GHVU01037508.1.p2  ORF type:complete len:165 (+),score=28.98 GHVU01037508.1:1714-2208(+)
MAAVNNAGKLYFHMEHVKEKFGATKLLDCLSRTDRQTVISCLNKRWMDMNDELYAIGYLLDPEFLDGLAVEKNPEVMGGWSRYVWLLGTKRHRLDQDRLNKLMSIHHRQSSARKTTAALEWSEEKLIPVRDEGPTEEEQEAFELLFDFTRRVSDMSLSIWQSLI